jgi:hypothetical protein
VSASVVAAFPVARPDVARSAAPERVQTASGDDRFADSLATARASESTPDDSDTTIQKARLAAQQRAQLQSLMLHGAMKFASTRGDVPLTANIPDSAISLPAAPASDADLALMLTTDATPPVSTCPPPPASAAMPMPAAHHENRASDAIVVQLGVIPKSLPTDAVEIVDSRAGEAAPDEQRDMTSNAALALIASLPLMPHARNLPIALDAADSPELAQQNDIDSASGDDAGQQQHPAAHLVEDHFDAPASVLAAGLVPASTATGFATAAPTASASASVEIVSDASSDASSDAGRIDVTGVQSDLSKLDPAFRERLERVIGRMRKEFGHRVSVVETARSQSRQNALYAQGRTAPGPVVTWTRNSKHSDGLAADLLVDGRWDTPQGYAHLAIIAKQEGLRTLGKRDPGHVELPGDNGVSVETIADVLADVKAAAGDIAHQMRNGQQSQQSDSARGDVMSRVANVAQVARVATVASVAKVAEVARPGQGAAAGAGESSSPVSPLAVSGLAPAAGATDLAGAVRATMPTTSVNMADRISQLMDLQATQSAKPLSSVLLRMENATGVDDQIRIDTRGTSVDARLGLGNASQVAALTDRIGELRDALERRGLTADGVRVQASTAPRAADSATFSRAQAPSLELAAMRAMSDSQMQGNTRDQQSRDTQQRDALARDQQRHTPRSSADDARNRSRREQQEARR